MDYRGTINALSIDVEDFHSRTCREFFDRDMSPTVAVVKNTEYFLEQLADHDTHATFFVLGEVAAKFPSLVRRIATAGHELGVHGHKHRMVHTLDTKSFLAEIEGPKKLIEDISGQAVHGHRAARFSITRRMSWALDVIGRAGFLYDSSIYPIRSSRYGDPSAPLEPFRVTTQQGYSLWELPPATLEYCGRRWPVCGGGYLRHFPYAVNKWALQMINRQRSAIIYMHPYEIEIGPTAGPDPNWSLATQVRYAMSVAQQLRNRSSVKAKLSNLLRDFSFATIRQTYAHILPAADTRPTVTLQPTLRIAAAT